jgi:hypothetical protein
LLLQVFLICLQRCNFILDFLIVSFNPLLPRVKSQIENIFSILLHEIQFVNLFQRR